MLASVVGAAALASTVLVPAAGAAEITPDVATDDITDNGNCTLREAVQASNTNAPVDDCPAGDSAAPDTIVLEDALYLLTLPGAGEINNQTGDLDVVPTTSSPLTIEGDSGEVEIDGTSGANTDRVLEKSTGASATSLTLNEIRLDDGEPPAGESGGALRVVGATEVTLNESRVTNSDTDSRGGGMLVVDDLTLNDSAVTGNGSTETTGAVGAGISSNGDVTLNNSVVDNNDVSAPDNGITDELSGGGVAASIGSLRIVNSTISDNNLDSADASDTALGGGISAEAIDVAIIGSTISGNSAGGNLTAFGLGGGLFYRDPAPVSSDLGIQNSTFSGNAAQLQGGAMQMNGGDTEVRSSTFTLNSAGTGSGATTSIFYSDFGDPASDFVIGGSILSESGALECGGAEDPTSGGFNIDRGTTCGFANTGDQSNTNPGLAALADNGGPTQTHVPLIVGGPAIDQIPAANCDQVDGLPLTIDQRSAPRPAEEDGDGIPECDVGAYEANRCQERIVNVVGTFGGDQIIGTNASDGILGLNGSDTIFPEEGNDRVCAGPDNDFIIERENEGTDEEVLGEGGTDRLSFIAAQSTINLATGTASTTGTNVTLGSIENATGTIGVDTITGDAGPNNLVGAGNNDMITGGGGADTLLGLTGDDQLFARDGVGDTVDCGDDTDTAQTDQLSIELSVIGCETVDALIAPVFTPPPQAAPPPAGNAQKRCRKGFKQVIRKGKLKCVKKKRKRRTQPR